MFWILPILIFLASSRRKTSRLGTDTSTTLSTLFPYSFFVFLGELCWFFYSCAAKRERERETEGRRQIKSAIEGGVRPNFNNTCAFSFKLKCACSLPWRRQTRTEKQTRGYFLSTLFIFPCRRRPCLAEKSAVKYLIKISGPTSLHRREKL